MSKLYEEAIADAHRLRELAEKTAERRIIEAMTPKIKMIVEQELTGEDAASVEIDDVLGAAEDYAEDLQNPSIDINVSGNANITLANGEKPSVEYENFPDNDGHEEVILSQEAAYALADIIHGQSQLKDFAGRLVTVREKIERFDSLIRKIGKSSYKDVSRAPARNFYTQLRKEVISLRDDVLLTERAEIQNEVRSSLENLIKEFQKMSRRHSNKLFGLLSEAELDELDVVFDEEDFESLGVEDTEDVEVGDLNVAVTMGGEEDVAEEEVEVDEEEPIDLGELDLVLDDEDLEVLGVEDTEDVGVEDLSVDVLMGDTGGEEEEVDVEEDEEVYEIDESALRRELRRMRRLREQDEAVDADPAVNHGGEVIGDVVLDVNEDDLLNVLADELGRVGDGEVADAVVEARRRRARKQTQRRGVNEGRRSRALRGQVKKYKAAVVALRTQLVEMNLFNAKLLYVNKLMQNRGLSSKQQRAIVEALDNARTLREAKLLYKSLTESLKKRNTLAEGRTARTRGSSSRSTRSAAPAKSGVEVDRWTVLAGLSD